MRSMFVVVAVVCFGGSLSAQPPTATAGEDVRVWTTSGPVVGALVSVTDSLVTLDTQNGTTLIPRRLIRSVQRQYRRNPRFNVTAALAGVAGGSVLARREPPSTVLAAAIVTGIGTGILAGAGKYAAPGAGVGGVVGSLAGVFVGLATYEPCTGWLCIDPGEGGWVLFSAIAFGATGAAAGTLIGALIPYQDWEWTNLTPTIEILQGQMGVGLTVRIP